MSVNVLQSSNLYNTQTNVVTNDGYVVTAFSGNDKDSILSSSSSDSTSTSSIVNETNSTSSAIISINNSSNNLNVIINNVVSSYSTRCHLNLRRIATEAMNVEYKKENGMIHMKLRKPQTTANIWSSGKITCTGAKSESAAYQAARRFCRILQKMGFRVKLCNYRVVNVLATCSLPFEIDIVKLTRAQPRECSYEPELHPGATYRLKEFKTTFKIFTTGSITLTAPGVDIINNALTKLYPILYENRKIKIDEPSSVKKDMHLNQCQQHQQQQIYHNRSYPNSLAQQNYHHQSVYLNPNLAQSYNLTPANVQNNFVRQYSAPIVYNPQKTTTTTTTTAHNVSLTAVAQHNQSQVPLQQQPITYLQTPQSAPPHQPCIPTTFNTSPTNYIHGQFNANSNANIKRSVFFDDFNNDDFLP